MTASRPRFCGQCGAALPPGDPAFCIECGAPVRGARPAPAPDPDPDEPEAPGATVRLPNARGDQAVVGGTVKLPTSGAVPPGMWFAPEPPGAEHIVAVYVPLRAVKRGWSGLTSHGWRKAGRAWAGGGSTRDVLRFEVQRDWFASAGAADGLRLRVTVSATSTAEEGRQRLGFRYSVGRNPPMQVEGARWLRADGEEVADLAVPGIQLMAPPRVARVSDLREDIRGLGAREANEWALAGAVHGVYELIDAAQTRTPLGRGLRLRELTRRAGLLERFFGLRYRVQISNPLVCGAARLDEVRGQAQEDASALGLDMESDAVVEWWLDRQGYDGAVLEPGAHALGDSRVVVAFRRAQIARISGLGSS